MVHGTRAIIAVFDIFHGVREVSSTIGRVLGGWRDLLDDESVA
jgi:hypothetical protein